MKSNLKSKAIKSGSFRIALLGIFGSFTLWSISKAFVISPHMIFTKRRNPIEDDTLTFKLIQMSSKQSVFDRRQPNLKHYLETLGKRSLLSSKEEVLLSRQIAKGNAILDAKQELQAKLGREPTKKEWLDAVGIENFKELQHQLQKTASAKSAMIQANLRLVASVAKSYRNKGLSYQDLIQEGIIGLSRAVDKFDGTRGFKFSTYAIWWIRQSIGRAASSKTSTIRVPDYFHHLLRKVRKARATLRLDFGSEPTMAEIAEYTSLSVAKTKMLLEYKDDTISMEQPKNIAKSTSDRFLPTSQVTLHEIIPDSRPGPEEISTNKMMKADIWYLLRCLTPREQEIIRLRFGLDDGKRKTLQEISNRYSLTRERVRQIEGKALHKLRMQPAYRHYRVKEHFSNVDFLEESSYL